ncbi:alpha/beta fold hydrolase [Pendulispora brunnea]|uniref:Alpha/beta fold hydrolase n=1 Tax=Pendulispora brunnea TaxID=2905690 RepID=A0ABZ2KGG0_9BACT
MLGLAGPRRAFTQLGGLDLHWAEMGRGRPLVLLHGISDSHGTWSRVAPRLARHRRVIMPDLPGHGFSGRPHASYGLDWYAESIGKWLDALGLDDFDLVGHSFGGGVAQRLLLEQAGARVGRLALVASGGLGTGVGLPLRLCASSGVVEHFGQPFMGLGTRIFLHHAAVFDREEIDGLSWLNSQPGSARVLSRTTRDVIDWRGQTKHFLDRAHEIEHLPPMIVYWGDRDPIIPARHATSVTDYLEGLYVVQLAGCGHFPHRECPDVFAGSLEAFLQADHQRRPRLRGPGLLPPRAERTRRARAGSHGRAHTSGSPFFARLWERVAAVFGFRKPYFTESAPVT